MAKRSKKVHHSKRQMADINLMMLAAMAALLVGAFALFSYGSNKINSSFVPGLKTLTVNLDAQNGSNEKGTAVLKEVDGKILVSLNLTGAPAGVSQPAHIHLGSCPNPGAIKFPLKSPVNGTSQTTLDTTFDKLKALGKLAVNVHKSATQAQVYVSCADLNF
ncbi:MAG TPA: hypothetical protein VF185_00010 [Patescibacteria group bacterium]